jgi:hypothetical protein
VRRNCDFHSFLYYLESAVRNGIEKAKEHGTTSAVTMLKLHTMDEEVFQQNGSIIPDKKRQ